MKKKFSFNIKFNIFFAWLGLFVFPYAIYCIVLEGLDNWPIRTVAVIGVIGMLFDSILNLLDHYFEEDRVI